MLRLPSFGNIKERIFGSLNIQGDPEFRQDFKVLVAGHLGTDRSPGNRRARDRRSGGGGKVLSEGQMKRQNKTKYYKTELQIKFCRNFTEFYRTEF